MLTTRGLSVIAMAMVVAGGANANEAQTILSPMQRPTAVAAAPVTLDKPGFTTLPGKHGRVWIFRADSTELAEFKEKGELAKHVVRPKAGPGGVTLIAPDADIITAYLTAREGFVTIPKEGRLWVFRTDSTELAEYKDKGELAKHIVRPKAGPGGVTLMAPDAETLDAYAKP